MDTDSHNPNDLDPLIPDSCSITLTSLQSMFYRSGRIDIYSADGFRLETIGYGVKCGDIEHSIYRLKEQMYVLECILTNLNSSIEFPAQAISALGDLLSRMQRFCREYIN